MAKKNQTPPAAQAITRLPEGLEYALRPATDTAERLLDSNAKRLANVAVPDLRDPTTVWPMSKERLGMLSKLGQGTTAFIAYQQGPDGLKVVMLM